MSEVPQDTAAPHPDPAPAASAPPAPSDAGRTKQQVAEFVSLLRELTPRAFVTNAIIVANLFLFVAAIFTGVAVMNPTISDLIKWGADHGPLVLNGEWWRLLTSAFLHIGVLHLAMNMYVLASVGPLVERMFGNTGFLVMYLVSGLVGSLASLCYDPLVVSAGASGAVFGVYGALLAVLRQKPGTVPRELLARIRRSGVLFVGYNLLFGFLLPGIDNAAHIGGLFAGFACGVILTLPLEPASRAKRPLQNVVAAVLGLVLVGAGVGFALALYADMPAEQTESDRVAELDGRMQGVYESARLRTVQGALSEAQFAEVIERDMLPEWRAAADRLAKLRSVPGAVRDRLDLVLNYMRLRAEAWDLTVQAMHEGDAKKMASSNETHDRANAVLKKLEVPGK